VEDKNWPRGWGETSNLSNLKIQEHHLDSDYEIVNENLARGETGLLKVFSLVPRQGTGKPRFEARIDDGLRQNARNRNWILTSREYLAALKVRLRAIAMATSDATPTEARTWSKGFMRLR
jgi:hypothetical protein